MSEQNGHVSRDMILGFRAAERKILEVEITGYGKFMLRECLGSDRETYWKLTEKMEDYRAGVVGIALSLVDASGGLLFSTSSEDIDILMELPMKVLDRLSLESMQMNRITADALEQTEKNS